MLLGYSMTPWPYPDDMKNTKINFTSIGKINCTKILYIYISSQWNMILFFFFLGFWNADPFAMNNVIYPAWWHVSKKLTWAGQIAEDWLVCDQWLMNVHWGLVHSCPYSSLYQTHDKQYKDLKKWVSGCSSPEPQFFLSNTHRELSISRVSNM